MAHGDEDSQNNVLGSRSGRSLVLSKNQKVKACGHVTSRSFVFSQNQTIKGRPEFLFLDTPSNMNHILSLIMTKNIENHHDCLPTNLSTFTFRPFSEDYFNETISFVARVYRDHHPFKSILEQEYLHGKRCVHGLIVMIAIGDTGRSFWGKSRVPAPANLTNASIDLFVERTLIDHANTNAALDKLIAERFREVMMDQE